MITLYNFAESCDHTVQLYREIRSHCTTSQGVVIILYNFAGSCYRTDTEQIFKECCDHTVQLYREL